MVIIKPRLLVNSFLFLFLCLLTIVFTVTQLAAAYYQEEEIMYMASRYFMLNYLVLNVTECVRHHICSLLVSPAYVSISSLELNFYGCLVV
jgi:hypothetical protein